MEKNANLILRIKESEKTKFMQKCKDKKSTPSKVLRAFISKFINEDNANDSTRRCL